MTHLKNKVVALLVVIAFFMTSVLPHQVAFADSGLDALNITVMEDDDSLVIGFSGANASTYAEAVDKIVVNGHVFTSGAEVTDTTYTRNAQDFELPSVWAPYKKNVIEFKTRGYGDRVVYYEKADGQTFAKGFEITSVVSAIEGDEQAKAESIQIALSHEELGPGELNTLFNRVTKFSIDDTDYNMRDSSGLKNFFLLSGIVRIYAKYPDGNKAVADFKKREKHKVVMFFEDGSSVEYKDDGYVAPNPSQPPTPPNPGEPSTPEPENGLAKRYTLNSVAVVDNYGKDLIIKTTPNLVPDEIKTIKVNSKTFNKSSFRLKYDGSYMSSDDDVVAAGEEKTPIDLVITFTDNSTLKTNNAPTPPQPEEKMGDKYKITNFSLEKETDEEGDTTEYLKLLVSPEMTAEDLKKIESFTVNDQVFDNSGNIKKIYWTSRDKYFRSDFSDVVAAVKSKNPVKIIIKFKDNTSTEKELTLAGNNPQPPQPEQKMGDKYQITTFSLEKDSHSKDFLKVSVSPEMAEADLAKVESIAVNDTVFDYSEAVKKIYWSATDKYFKGEAPEVITAVKSKNPVKIVVKFKDNSKVEKELKLAGNDPTPNPNDNIAKKYTLGEVVVKKNFSNVKMLTIGISPALDFADKQKMTKLIVNGKEFPANKFFTSLVDGFHTTDEEVVSKAETATNIGLAIHFEDGSILKNQYADQEFPKTVAEKAVLTEATFDQTSKALSFKLNLKPGEAGDLQEAVKKAKLVVNDVNFEVKEARFDYDTTNRVFKTKDADVIEATKKANPAVFQLMFADGSKLDGKAVYQGSGSTSELDNLGNGTYTLSYAAYQAGSNQTDHSVLENFFDVRAKLVVEDGVKTVTLLNTKFPEMLVDFAIKKDGQYASMKREEILNAAGKAKEATYTISLNSLSGLLEAKILGTGMMGGSPSDKGNYDSKSYRPVDLVFKEATPDWKGFEKHEKEQENREKNDAKLKDFFEEHFDTNRDGVVSDEEFAKAKGVKKTETFASFNNALDLTGMKLIDISLLSKVGGDIDAIYLEGNKVESLPANVFSNMKKLRYVFLSGNNVSEISPKAFEGLTNLTYLDINASPLGTVPTGTFDTNKNLQILSMADCSLVSLPKDLLKNNKKLVQLFLGENKLERLDDDFFSGQDYHLDRIDIANNNLKALPSSMKKLTGLTQFSALNNDITEISEDTFANMKKLKRVDLSANHIDKFPLSLARNMISIANSGTLDATSLDLSLNNISSIPVEAMFEQMTFLNGGQRPDENSKVKGIKYLNIDRNNLKTDLTEAEKRDLKLLGIAFTDSLDTYYPQNANSNMKAEAKKGKINLKQDFSILEMEYWAIGDLAYFQGKEAFESAQEFLEYLLNGGRKYNGVDMSLSREDAIVEILKGGKYGRYEGWRVNTKITKNGNVIYDDNKNTSKEPLEQVFTDADMKAGDEYTLTKTLYTKVTSGLAWKRTSEYSTTFKATESAGGNINPQPQPENTMKAYVVTKDKKNLSMADKAFERNVTYKEVTLASGLPGKEFTLKFKPLTLQGATAQVDTVEYDKMGTWAYMTKEIGKTGEFKVSIPDLAFQAFAGKALEVPIRFTLTPQVAGHDKPIEAVLVLDANNNYEPPNGSNPQPEPQPEPEKTMKAYVVTKDKKNLSMADRVFERNVTYKTVQIASGMAGKEFTLKFKPMTLQGETAKVDTIEYDKMGTWTAMTKETGKDGEFKVQIPDIAFAKTQGKALELPIRFTLTPKVSGHDDPLEAVLVLDANNNYEPPNGSNPQPEPQPEPEKTMKAYVVTKDKKNLSMADRVFERNVTYKTVQIASGMAGKEFTLKFKPMTLQGETAKVDTIEYDKMGTWAAMTKETGKDGEFKVQIPDIAFAKTQGKALELPIRFTLTPKVTGHDKPIEAVLILDSNNNYQPPSNPSNPSKPSEPSSPGEKVHNIPVWVKKADSNEPSVANNAINHTARVVEKGGEFTYKVSFRPISLKFGGKDITGHIVSFIVDGKTISGVTEGEETSYEFTLNSKVNELPVKFEVDAMKDLGAGAREAILVFNWDGSSAPSGGGGGGALAPSNQKEDVESLISRAEEIIKDKANYDAKLLAKLQTALKNAKDEKNEDNRLALLELVKEIEKTKKNLKKDEEKVKEDKKPKFTIATGKTYMKGYSDGTFRPNKAMTRAEVASVLASLIENKATDQKGAKDVRQGAWYADAISKAISLGYMKGYSDGSFKPNEGVTRAEYAAILVNIKGLKASKAMKFKDMKDSHWASASIAAAVEAGIMSGYGNDLVKPDKVITRAEFIVMTNRAFDLKEASGEAQSFKDVPANHWAYAEIVKASKI